MTDLPPCPEDVRVLMRDGRMLSVECRYVGIEPETGCHCWTVTIPLDPVDVLSVHVAVLPSMTMVRLEP